MPKSKSTHPKIDSFMKARLEKNRIRNRVEDIYKLLKNLSYVSPEASTIVLLDEIYGQLVLAYDLNKGVPAVSSRRTLIDVTSKPKKEESPERSIIEISEPSDTENDMPSSPILIKDRPLNSSKIAPRDTSTTDDSNIHNERPLSTTLDIPSSPLLIKEKPLTPLKTSLRDTSDDPTPKDLPSSPILLNLGPKKRIISNSEFKYSETVRKKEDRKEMHGYDCACCKSFYEAAGYVGEKQEKINSISRHRTLFRVSDTPEGFWDAGYGFEE